MLLRGQGTALSVHSLFSFLPIVSQVENSARFQLCIKEVMMSAYGFRWLARRGDWCWAKIVDPILRFCIGQENIASLRRLRGIIQLTVLVALLLLPLVFFLNRGHVLTASGLLFDIAGVLRLFLLKHRKQQVEDTPLNDDGAYSASMISELIIPDGIYIREIINRDISTFYYNERAFFFLSFGFILQLLGNWL